MRILKQLGAVVAVAVVGNLAVGATSGVVSLALGALAGLAALAAYARVVRRTEHRVPVEVTRAGAPAAIGRGVLIGLGMCVAVMATVAVFGGYHVHGWGSLSSAAGVLGVTVVVGVTEELVFRGVLLRVVEERAGTWVALASTAALFGAIHLLNPHATPWGAIAIAVEAGAMLAAAFVATRTLWLPIGLHVGWNFALGGLFGTEVSGSGTATGLVHGLTSGPVWLSGGEFGPEASVFTVLAGVLLTLVFLRLAHRRGRIVANPRRAARAAATTTV
ncbi:CPBP family intramembrane metalloprotease [Cellulomonas sp. DKR-3]|uniref:CPBP family intramembrane metalloprotease n=1 Tax=Cellulomonas fulva TaxID=2835530 RepID=A0ABS5TXA7_9CELL|nr:CPBP family intramembrane glutamic endopeptidase [Cellulomonas fulva]MBT0993791.1 CPBP family intramembrane metalloprotease [Cellulomonas fulva]